MVAAPPRHLRGGRELAAPRKLRVPAAGAREAGRGVVAAVAGLLAAGGESGAQRSGGGGPRWDVSFPLPGAPAPRAAQRRFWSSPGPAGVWALLLWRGRGER